MNINGRRYRTIWLKEDDKRVVQIINQLVLPHRFEILDLRGAADVQRAIKDMYVRGAGLIGAAAFGMHLAALEAGDSSFEQDMLRAEKRDIARRTTQAIADQNAEWRKQIGAHGLNLIKAVAEQKRRSTGRLRRRRLKEPLEAAKKNPAEASAGYKEYTWQLSALSAAAVWTTRTCS